MPWNKIYISPVMTVFTKLDTVSLFYRGLFFGLLRTLRPQAQICGLGYPSRLGCLLWVGTDIPVSASVSQAPPDQMCMNVT